jgi:hypothetical protein
VNKVTARDGCKNKIKPSGWVEIYVCIHTSVGQIIQSENNAKPQIHYVCEEQIEKCPNTTPNIIDSTLLGLAVVGRASIMEMKG